MAFESFEPVPHYRVPYELSKDYWLYERWLDQLPPDAISVVGDSVVWGEYTAHDGTLSRFLGDATGKPRSPTPASTGCTRSRCGAWSSTTAARWPTAACCCIAICCG